MDKILPQLKNGNEFVLPYEDWLTGNFIDILVYAGYHEEFDSLSTEKLVRIKLTNTDRRKLLRMNRFS
jgi:hypothetical protein